jgi:hypothetical protein
MNGHFVAWCRTRGYCRRGFPLLTLSLLLLAHWKIPITEFLYGNWSNSVKQGKVRWDKWGGQGRIDSEGEKGRCPLYTSRNVNLIYASEYWERNWVCDEIQLNKAWSRVKNTVVSLLLLRGLILWRAKIIGVVQRNLQIKRG